MLASQLEVGDRFRDPLETRLWYVVDVEERGDDVHVFYSENEDDEKETSEAVYDSSAVVYVERSVEVE